jgi:hypothetical protein
MSEFDNTTYFINAVNYVNITYNSSNSILNKIKIYCGNTLPTGYYWCDGNNNTPDLRNFFIYSVSSNNTTFANNSTTFGSQHVTVPHHNHTINTSSTSYTRNTSPTFVLGYDAGFNNIKRTLPGAVDASIRASDGKEGNGGNKNYAGIRHKHAVDDTDTTSYTVTVNGWNGQSNNVDVNGNINASSIKQASGGNLNFNNTNSIGTTGNSGTPVAYKPSYIKVGFIMKS